MRKTISLAIWTCYLVLVGATSALAQDPNYPPGGVGGSGGVSDVSGSGSTAFTGGDVTLPVLLAIGLLVLATAALILGRRRAKAFSSIQA